MSDASSLKVEGHSGDKAGDLRGVLPAGTSLRGYELKSILGQGAFGITYRARDLNLDRDVAIKEYLPTSLALREGRTTVLPRSPDHAEQFAWGRERFLEEARTLARLDRTPAIVRVHDFLEDNGTAYMVMALIEGETLAKRLMRERQLAPEAIERILWPLLDGLDEVHGIGFLHRDIKPANVMIDRAGRPTLIDFGASRAAMAERSSTMTAIFTPGYAAAEQFTSAKLGPWTDIYGLAATMYHCITGTISPSAIDRILKDECEPLAELRPEGFAPELMAGIDAGMAIRAEARPHNIAQWRHALRSGERPVASVETTRIERRRRHHRRSGLALRGPALWGAAAAAVLLLAGAGWLAYRADGPPTVGTAAQVLTAEQLEQALAERRKADSLAAEKRKLEDEARLKAEAEAESKRQAEAELQRTREARLKAEQELEELKARIAAAGRDGQAQRGQQAVAEQQAREAEAKRLAEAQAALRAAEEEAQKKAEADAEAKRVADEALAAAEADRRRAEQEAETKAVAETQALQRTPEEAQRKAADAERQKADAEAKARADAEAAEKTLRLEQADRQRLQMALTELGFDTRGSDGLLGPRSREMIANWQKARRLPPTGFLNDAQRQQLLKEAAPALARLDEKQKAEDEAKARAMVTTAAVAAAPPATAVAGAGATSSFDGSYSGILYGGSVKVALQLSRGAGTVMMTVPGCEPIRFPVAIAADGRASGRTYLNCSFGATVTGSNLRPGDFEIDGQFVQQGRLRLWFRNPSNTFSLDLRPGREPDVVSKFDGTYIGRANSSGSLGWDGPAKASLRLEQGRGAVVIEVPACPSSSIPISISAVGEVTGEGALKCTFAKGTQLPIAAGDYSVDGRLDGRDLKLTFRGVRGNFLAIMRREPTP